jgi:hypothetical protein
MPENETVPTLEGFAPDFNPFSDDVPQVQQNKVEEVTTLNTDNTQQVNTVVEDQKSTEQPSTSFDPNSFVKERFGYESVEEAEQEIRKFKDKKDFEFADDSSRNLFNAIREGKTDDVFSILNEQKKLEKLTNSEINSDIAVDIIKTSIANKYKDLTSDEVDLLFYENYNFPRKPEQAYDEPDEDYKQKLKGWESQMEFIEKRMVIDAKVARPELEKLKSELKLPDVDRVEEREEASREEFEMLQQARQVYEKTLDAEFQNFKGFDVMVKDEDVEIPISFNISDEERLSLKESLSDFDADSYLENRWFTEDGKPNVKQVMADRYVLENLPKILQKFANEAASQRLLAHIKKSGNVTINQTTPQGTPTQNPNAQMDALADWAFGS